MTKILPNTLAASEQALVLPQRSPKPRQTGITAIIDVGLTLAAQAQLLESYHTLFDFAKLGTGAAYINPVLREKIKLYEHFDIPVCFGGTLFEKYVSQDKIGAYRDYLQALGVHWVEISSGILDIPQAQLIEIALDLQADFTVVAEVGKKFGTLSHSSWLEAIQAYLAIGIDYVILEGRSTANAGIYDTDGGIDQDLIDKIKTQLDMNQLWFEGANKQAYTQLIQSLGTNVNISNVNPHDVVSLEALRMGLRAETFTVT